MADGTFERSVRIKMIRRIGWLLVGCWLFLMSDAQAGPTIAVKPMRTAGVENPSDSGKAAGTQKPLRLSELIQKVVVQNLGIQARRFGWHISQAQEAGSHALFEPDLVVAGQFEDNREPNTVEESITRLSERVYDERNWETRLAVEGVTPTGGQYNLGYNLNRLSNSVIRAQTEKEHETEMFLGVHFRQPLLKNAGFKVTRAAIHAAEKETRASFQDYRQQLMRTVSEAGSAYWVYYRTQENLILRQDSIRVAENVMADNRTRQQMGKMARTEVLEARSGLASRKSLLLRAQHAHRRAANRLHKVLSVPADHHTVAYQAIDAPFMQVPSDGLDALTQQALALRPDHLANQQRLQQVQIQRDFAINQQMPELDLLASYGHNGLGNQANTAWDQVQEGDFQSWALGLEFRMPLGGGIDTRNEAKAAQLAYQRQSAILKETMIEMINTIDTALDRVHSASKQWAYARQIVDIEKQLLDAELARFDAGKSSTRLLLEKEDNHREAKEFALKHQVDFQIALMKLQLADGSILQNHGVDISEESP